MIEKIQNIKCNDIYDDEMQKGIRDLKRLREAWLHSATRWDMDLFQFADPDFYFYRFIIERLEKNKEDLITSILCRVMERYGISFEIPGKRKKDTHFAFIVCDQGKRIGYRYIDFYYNENVNEIVHIHNLDKVVIIRTIEPEIGTQQIIRENKQYMEKGLNIRAISISAFFGKYFGQEEYESFREKLNSVC